MQDDAKWHLDVTEWLKGGVINTAEMACKFAELVLEHTQSKDVLEKQRPLTAEDRGDTWFIQGSWNRDKSQEGSGPFEMLVKKRDAQILDLGIQVVMKTPPSRKARLRELMKTPEEKARLEAFFRAMGEPPEDGE